MLFNKMDLKYTLRLLAKKPGFSLLCVLIVAGGLGISIVMFTLSYTLMFKELPMTNGASIHRVCYAAVSLGCRAFKVFEFQQLRRDITTLDNVGIYYQQFENLAINDNYYPAQSVYTESNMFQLSGTSALLGRTLQPADELNGAEPVVVLSYDLWQRAFNGSTDVLDAVVNMRGVPTQVVGVMPKDYLFPIATTVWLPVSPNLLDPLADNKHSVSAFARLKPGTTKEQASLEVASLMQRVRDLFPPAPDTIYVSDFSRELDRSGTAHVQTFPMSELGGFETVALFSFLNFLSGCIFLLAAINVGTLMLARTNERLKDVSIKVALGASRIRLLAQTMGESVLITLLGGVLALLFAGAVLELISLFLNSAWLNGTRLPFPFWFRFHVDGSTLFAVAVFLLLTIFCTSFVPCWRIVNGDFNAVMRDGTRGALGKRAGRFSRSLVLVAITLITLLMYIGAIAYGETSILIQTVSNTPTKNIVGTNVGLSEDSYTNLERAAFYQSLSSALLQEPSISAVRLNAFVSSDALLERVNNAGNTATGMVKAPLTAVFTSSDILDVELLQGRHLDAQDGPESPRVALISKTLAAQLWPDQSPIDQSLRIVDNQRGAAESTVRVVGVVSETVNSINPLAKTAPVVYLPLTQVAAVRLSINVNAREVAPADQNAITEEATNALTRLIINADPTLTFQIENAEEVQNVILRMIRLATRVAIGSIIFALFVAMAGIYGLNQNAVQLMGPEIGTRRALGATDSKIRNMLLVRGSKQVLTGFILAALISSPLTYVVISLIKLEVLAPVLAYVVAAMLCLYVVVYFAIYIPVRRILAMEPAEALRYE